MPTTHHCPYKGCKSQPSSKRGPGCCVKHQWVCENGHAKLPVMIGQKCGKCGAEQPKSKKDKKK